MVVSREKDEAVVRRLTFSWKEKAKKRNQGTERGVPEGSIRSEFSRSDGPAS